MKLLKKVKTLYYKFIETIKAKFKFFINQIIFVKISN